MLGVPPGFTLITFNHELVIIIITIIIIIIIIIIIMIIIITIIIIIIMNKIFDEKAKVTQWWFSWVSSENRKDY